MVSETSTPTQEFLNGHALNCLFLYFHYLHNVDN